MQEEADPNAKSRAQLPILLGIVGAVAGYVGTVALLIFLSINTTDPQTTFTVIVLFIGPVGAVIGAFAGAKLGLLARPPTPPAADSAAAASPVAASPATGAPDIRAVP